MAEKSGAGQRDHCVLVVEDDQSLRDLIRLALEREDLAVTTAKDGAEGIKFIDSDDFSVLLLDLMMPRVSGWDVLEWLKEHPSQRPRTVIVTTAADRSVFSELDPQVVNAVVVKPFDIWELAGYVLRCCEAPIKRDRRRKRQLGAVL